jgi:pimeloyl-ACP methyl ester carboxylesterase
MPNIQAEIIPDAGHIPSMDQPEMVNERILKFLNKNFHALELQK